MVITTYDMEVKQLIESSLCAMSGYNHAVDIGLFSAVVKADKHQERGQDKKANQRFWKLCKRPMTIRNEVYSQLRPIVDINSGADLNSYALLDEWSLLKNKKVIVYTFNENDRGFKVEYQTPYRCPDRVEILKTSIDDIVIAYHAITDINALLTKLRKLYNIPEEDPVKYDASGRPFPPPGPIKSDAQRKKEYFEAKLKELETKHVPNSYNWEQLNKAMRVHIRDCPVCYPPFYTDECPDTGYFARMHDASPKLEGEDPKYAKTFWGTPFHALMIGINNHEKYNRKTTDYKKYLKILRHIKEVNPAVCALHTESPPKVDTFIMNGVVMTKEEYEQHVEENKMDIRSYFANMFWPNNYPST